MAETKKIRCKYDFKYLELFSAGTPAYKEIHLKSKMESI